MAVPAHDTRDHEFALKYNIPIQWVVRPDDETYGDPEKAFSDDGIIINSSSSKTGLDINGLSNKEAASKVIEWAEKTENGKRKVPFSVHPMSMLPLEDIMFFPCITIFLELKLVFLQVNYKLRDWLFARQRYWGEPIPVIFLDSTSETVPVLETELPLTLPELDDFTPTGTGEPPLSKAVSWVCFLHSPFLEVVISIF